MPLRKIDGGVLRLGATVCKKQQRKLLAAKTDGFQRISRHRSKVGRILAYLVRGHQVRGRHYCPRRPMGGATEASLTHAGRARQMRRVLKRGRSVGRLRRFGPRFKLISADKSDRVICPEFACPFGTHLFGQSLCRWEYVFVSWINFCPITTTSMANSPSDMHRDTQHKDVCRRALSFLV